MSDFVQTQCPHVALEPISSPDGIEYYKCVVCGEKFCKGCESQLNDDGLCPICDNYLYDHQ